MTYELERKYLLRLNAFECGLLMGIIQKEKDFADSLKEVRAQLLRIYEQTYEEAKSPA